MGAYNQTWHLHYNDVKWTSWRLNSPTTRMFVQKFVQDDNKINIKGTHNLKTNILTPCGIKWLSIRMCTPWRNTAFSYCVFSECYWVITVPEFMMTSSNGNIFRVTGPLCGEFTGPGEFPTQRSVTRSFDVFFDLRLNKRLSKQPWGWWFEPPSWSLWRHRNVQLLVAQLQQTEGIFGS